MEIQLLGDAKLLRGPTPPTSLESPAAVRFERLRELCVLVILAQAPRQRYTLEQLINGLWGEHPPNDAARTARRYVNVAQRAIVEAGGNEEWLSDHGQSYSLDINSDIIDYHRFKKLVRMAQEYEQRGDSNSALRSYRQALDLVKGNALANLKSIQWAASRGYLIDQDCLDARHKYFELRLRTAASVDEPAEVADEITHLIDQHPSDKLIRLGVEAYAKAGRQSSIGSFCRHASQRMLAISGGRPSRETDAYAHRFMTAPEASVVLPRPVPRQENDRPFPGLHAFESNQEQWFFGRGADIDKLVTMLTNRMCPVVLEGSSGAGKTSLLRAGLGPELRAKGLIGPAEPLSLTPTSEPCKNLATKFARHVRPDLVAMVDELATDSDRLAGLLRETSPDGARLVIVVDQFEETFTVCTDERERARFIRTLCAAATDTEDCPHPALVVLGIRADFTGELSRFPQLLDSMHNKGRLTLGGIPELRDVIEMPAHNAGLRFEPGLVEKMLLDVGADDAERAEDGRIFTPQGMTYEPGRLPLLAHALKETWRKRKGNVLTHEGYRAIGGVQGAIAKTADEICEGLGDVKQDIARHLLLGMIGFGDGDQVVRRRVALGQLIDAFPDKRVAEEVRDVLARGRLITLHHGAAEITHEVLLRNWGLLVDWIKEDRAGLLVRQKLIAAADAWEPDRHPADLYQGPRLAGAREWERATGSRAGLPAHAREFLAAAIRHEDETVRAARRSRRRLRLLVVGLSVALVIALATGIGVFVTARTAFKLRDVETSRGVASAAAPWRGINPALATQLSLAAYRIYPTVEGRSSLLSAFATPYANRLTAHTDTVDSVAYSPDKRTLATASQDGTTRLWDVTNPHRPRERYAFESRDGGFRSAAFSPDGRTLATSGADSAVRLWNVSDPAHPARSAVLRDHHAEVWSVVFGPGDSPYRLLATASLDNTVRLWEVSDPLSPIPLHTFDEHTDAVSAVAISPDATTLATASLDDTVRLWDITNPRVPVPIAVPDQHRDDVFTVAFSPNGKLLATGSADRTAQVWDVTDPRHLTKPHVLHDFSNRAISSVMFDRDGTTLATASQDGAVYLWDTTDLNALSYRGRYTGHAGELTSAAFSPDGTTLATGSTDRTVRLWDMPPPALRAHAGIIHSVDLSRDGRILATASRDRTARLWDITDPRWPRKLATLPGHTHNVDAAIFSPKPAILATVSFDRTARLWHVGDPRQPRLLSPLTDGHTNGIVTADFTSDGNTFATGSFDGTVRLWDVAHPREPKKLGSLKGHEDAVTMLAITRTGPGREVLATIGLDRKLRLWDITDPHQPGFLAERTVHESNQTWGLAISPDGTTLATASDDRTVGLWDITDPRHPAELNAITDGTQAFVSVAFGGDGATLVTGARGGLVQLWDVTDPRQVTGIARFSGHTGSIEALTISPDLHTVISAGSDFRVRLWETDPERVAARVCDVAYPAITEEEWHLHISNMAYRPLC